MPVRFAVQSPRGVPGAIALLRLTADTPEELDLTLISLGADPLPSHTSRLREIDGEEVVIARWSPLDAHIMPHGGVEVMKRIVARLARTPASETTHHLAPSEDPHDPEACVAGALAHAASPLAIDFLLDQRRRLREGLSTPVAPDHAAVLRHLIDPPLIVAWGPPNVGKSTLLNALARTEISIVAPEAGTTRDHVGVLLNLGGLVVRYADTPGIRPDADPAEEQAIDIARSLVSAADLVLWCSDRLSERPALPSTVASIVPLDLRSDLGLPAKPAAFAVSARSEESVLALAFVLREALVPIAALQDPGLWAFWNA